MNSVPFRRTRDAFALDTNPARLDFDRAHALLHATYWAKNMPRETLRTAIENSLCFGLYHQDRTIGIARVVTDLSTFAYLTDVVVDEAFRGQGLAVWMMGQILSHPNLQGLRRFLLLTSDAHRLYQKVGFRAPEQMDWFLEIRNPDVYPR